MKTFIVLKKHSTYLFLLLAFCCISCNSKVVTHGNTARAKLPVLYIEKASFHQWDSLHNTKIMFRFTYFDGSITLTGWAPTPNDSSDTYDTVNIFPLKASTDKQVKFSDTRLYLGNLRLSRDEVISLDSQLTANPNAHYLVFKPMLDGIYPQQVSYKIFLSSSTHFSDTLYTIDPKADPSPPATRK